MDEPPYDSIYVNLFDRFASPDVDEVLVNGAQGVWYVARGAVLPAGPSPFSTPEALTRWVQELARRQGVRLDPLCGAAGGSLGDGRWRWHCVLGALSPDGPLLSIRRHRFAELSVADFAGDPAVKADLVAAAVRRDGLLVVGPTGSGKSTLVAALLREHAADERVAIVESTPELPLLTAASIRLIERRANVEGVGAIGLARLVQEALRLRPDRLVIGEIRGHEAGAYLDALLCGHDGTVATLHAATVRGALVRLMSLANAPAVSIGSLREDAVALTVVVLTRGDPPRIREVATVGLAF